MAEVYGFANRVVAEIVAEILNHNDVGKFLYYTKDLGEDILSLPKPSPSKLLNKSIFIGRRVDPILFEGGAYLCVRAIGQSPYNRKSEVLKEVDVEILVVTHQSCSSTPNGTRDMAIICGVQDAIEDKVLSGIGKNSVFRVYDVAGLPSEYSGYVMQCRVQGFPNTHYGV